MYGLSAIGDRVLNSRFPLLSNIGVTGAYCHPPLENGLKCG